jgi:hypothetical protein
MRRLLAILAGMLLALLVGPGVASATHGPSDNPPRDLFFGRGEFLAGGVEFNVHATSGPLGEDPHGHLSWQTEGADEAGDPPFRGPVTCLVVSGNRATAGAPVRTGPPGQTAYVIGVDNPDPAPDQAIAVSSTIPANQAGCTTVHTLGFTVFPVDGEVTIHDGQPVP